MKQYVISTATLFDALTSFDKEKECAFLEYGEYIPVKKEERKTIMTTRAQIQQEYGIVDTMPSYIADRELSPKEEENYRKIMDARKDGELVVDGFDLDR